MKRAMSPAGDQMTGHVSGRVASMKGACERINQGWMGRLGPKLLRMLVLSAARIHYQEEYVTHEYIEQDGLLLVY